MPGRRSLALLLLATAGLACGDDDATAPSPEPDVAALTVGRQHACRVTVAGTYCWGGGEDGQLGIGAAPVTAPPTLLMDAPELVSLAAGSTHTCGLDDEGVAYCWGSDRDGQLGLGVQAAERCGALPCATRPTPLAGGLRFRMLAGGEVGREPVGSTVRFDEPVEVSGGLRFTRLAGGSGSYCGITTEGSTVCWGRGTEGQPGSGTQDRSSPVVVPGL
ncbi:MAG TPA: hypothetical protein VHG35_03305 [Gemmatimonadales bacterium]|nr:hypothetical protein [Gemmatimonadales bacterium]